MKVGLVVAVIVVLSTAPFTAQTAAHVGDHGPCPAPGGAGDDYMTDGCGKVFEHGFLAGASGLVASGASAVVVRRGRRPDSNVRFALVLLVLGAGGVVGILSLVANGIAPGGGMPFWAATVLPILLVVPAVGRVAELIRPVELAT